MAFPRFISEVSEGKITNYNDLWFLRDSQRISGSSYPIDYTLVILYSLRNWMKCTNKGTDEAKKKLETLLDSLTKKTGQNFKEAYFLEVYFLNNTFGSYCVVDQSNGIFPLILYGENDRKDPDDKDRMDGFITRLKIILETFNKVRPLLENKSEWTSDYQLELLKAVHLNS